MSTKKGPVTPAELELGRRILAILEAEVEEVLMPAWRKLSRRDQREARCW